MRYDKDIITLNGNAMKKLLLLILTLFKTSPSFALFDFNNWSTEMIIATHCFAGFSMCVGISLYLDKQKDALRKTAGPQANVFQNPQAAQTRANSYFKLRAYEAPLETMGTCLFYLGIGAIALCGFKKLYQWDQESRQTLQTIDLALKQFEESNKALQAAYAEFLQKHSEINQK